MNPDALAQTIRDYQDAEHRYIARSRLKIARNLRKARRTLGGGQAFDEWIKGQLPFSRRQVFNLLRMLDRYEEAGEAIFNEPTWGAVFAAAPRNRATGRKRAIA